MSWVPLRWTLFVRGASSMVEGAESRRVTVTRVTKEREGLEDLGETGDPNWAKPYILAHR
jgi:hypothetical protein